MSGDALARPGRFRRIKLATGEELDLNKPDLGRPDGIALWDAAAQLTSHRNAPTAFCLFPGCVAAGATSLYFQMRGPTRVAAHHTGSRESHAVATGDALVHDAGSDFWRSAYVSSGWPIADNEHSYRRGKRVIRRGDVHVDGRVQVNQEIQISPKSVAAAVRRDRDLAQVGVTTIWNPWGAVDFRDRVPQVRFTTNIRAILETRDPLSLPLLGVRTLRERRAIQGRRIELVPEPRQVTLGDFCAQTPAGVLVPTDYLRKQRMILTAVEAERLQDFMSDRPAEKPVRSRPPQGELRRHVELSERIPFTARRTSGTCMICGASALLYPAGWRCDSHQPGIYSPGRFRLSTEG